MATTEQQYRVTGKSGPGSLAVGVLFSYLDHEAWLVTAMHGVHVECCKAKNTDRHGSISTYAWNDGRYDILEAISPPQAAVATCETKPVENGIPAGCKIGTGWTEAPVAWKCVASLFGKKHAKENITAVVTVGIGAAFKGVGGPTSLCLDCAIERGAVIRDAATAVTCIRSACKAPPVAGGELCAAHAGQVETVKAKRCAWEVNGVSACDLPRERRRYCPKHSDEYHAGMTPGEAFVCPRCQRPSDARDINPVCLGKRCVVREANQVSARPATPAPAEARLERWRREHKGYSHGTADPRIHDANVAAMMVGLDGPREPYVPPPKLPAWTPRDLDGDIPDAWDPGGARLGGTR